MDSFYDAPRRPPQLIPKEPLAITPVVPEISVLCPSNPHQNAFTPYSQWKSQPSTMQNQFVPSNKENYNGASNMQYVGQQNSSILKKQVRFGNPVLQQKSSVQFTPILEKNNVEVMPNQQDLCKNDLPRTLGSFEKMYMANIPSRQLDLSVIDIPNRKVPNHSNALQNVNKKEELVTESKDKTPKSYRAFVERHKVSNKVILNDSVTDILNYKKSNKPSYITSPNIEAKSPNNCFSRADNQNNYNAVDSPGFEAKISQKKMEKFRNSAPCTNSENNEHLNHKSTKSFQETEPLRQNLNGLVYENNNRNTQYFLQAPQSDPNILRYQNEGLQLHETSLSYLNHARPEKGQNENIFTNVHINSRQNKCSSNSNKQKSFEHDCIERAEKSVTKCDSYTQTTNDTETNPTKVITLQSEEVVSAKDLLKIISQQSQQISQQNEQILLLQKQVSALLFRVQDVEVPNQKSICYKNINNCCGHNNDGHNHAQNIQERCLTSTQHENFEGNKRCSEGTPKKNKNRPNFSIGLTTSFEVSIRNPPTNKQPNHQNVNHFATPKIQEITETESSHSTNTDQPINQGNCLEKFENYNKTLGDASMVFKEPITVKEACPSPEPSIKIHMNDYEGTDSEEECTSPSEIGPSFYRNLMAQVNNILKKAQIQTTEDLTCNFKGQNLKNKTLHKVKEATLKHLRSIGVEVPPFEDSISNSSRSEFAEPSQYLLPFYSSSEEVLAQSYDNSDISFAVKQLLMKYLPADHLARVGSKKSERADILTPKEKIGAIKNRPEFSFATVQYMKKYNLIASSENETQAKPNSNGSPKILDISKLKQQPKLL